MGRNGRGTEKRLHRERNTKRMRRIEIEGNFTWNFTVKSVLEIAEKQGGEITGTV